jgi:ribosomal protein L11 methyltransferase
MRRAGPLETVFVVVPEEVLEAYEAALGVACSTLGFFLEDEGARSWRVEGVKPVGDKDEELAASLALAAALSGHVATLHRAPTEAEGWLAKVHTAFPEQRIGRRFVIRGTHLPRARAPGAVTLTIDAGLAFGSGEHGSTRGCLIALERIAYRRPARIMDMGTGSGVLAMGASALLRKTVDAVDNDPWSVRVTQDNAALNGLRNRLRVRLGNGWLGVKRGARFDLIFANILARPLCMMARQLASHLAPGGTVILAGLLSSQINTVLAAHRRQGLRLEQVIREENWATLVLRS